MKPTLLVALCHASVALHVPFPINEVKNLNTSLKQATMSEQIMISSAREKSGIFEGDIILSNTQPGNNIDYNDLTEVPSLWPSKEIPYIIIDEHFNNVQLQAIKEAIGEINRVSCLNFQATTEFSTGDAVVIRGDGPGCYSYVGYFNSKQVINLSNIYDVGNGCFHYGSIMHEILHTLGFHHTHARFDRDEYIDIVWNNIKEGKTNGFEKKISPRGIDLVTSYDYNSCMHYGRKAFSRTGEDTIIPKVADVTIGQREGLSLGDIERLNLLYCK